MRLITRSDGFPNHAFMMRKSPIWYLSDVEAHNRGEPFQERVPGDLQHQVMTTSDIGQLCGFTTNGVRDAMYHGRPTVPGPAGQVMGYHYWFRIAVEFWAEATENQDALTKLLAHDESAGT